MPTADWILDRCTAVTPAGDGGPLAGSRQGDLEIVESAAIAIQDGRITAIGPRDPVLRDWPGERLDLGGAAVLPGFVDAHTHPIWAGDRIDDFERRVSGASYVEIAEAGGGIASTVRATRGAALDDLARGLRSRLMSMAAHGTTTVEAKTGYGLNTAAELLHLGLLADADALGPIRVVPTFLGAHAVPDEYAGRQGDYVDLVVEEMLPAVAELSVRPFVDVFCDVGAFTRDETERIITQARALGLPLKLHADEFADLGCTEVAAGLGATSIDHLVHTGPQAMDAMARAGTVAVVLPGTTFGLGSHQYADAREMIARSVSVALGSDFNPGTCPCPSLPLVAAIGSRYLSLTPSEVVVALTANAAAATGLEGVGRLTVGGPADLVVLRGADYRVLAYEFGVNPVAGTMAGGQWVTGQWADAVGLPGSRP